MYDRRVPIYRTTIKFVRDFVNDAKPELVVILRFAADTEEARFLCDETVAAYLAEMFKKALRLRTINQLRERMVRDGDMENFHVFAKKQTDLTLWFKSQYEVIRNYFAPFLHPA